MLIVEEGQPAYIEDAVLATLRRAAVEGVKVRGKDVLPMAGEYTGEVVLTGVSRFLDRGERVQPIAELKSKAAELLAACRRARRASASAARSGRCSRR